MREPRHVLCMKASHRFLIRTSQATLYRRPTPVISTANAATFFAILRRTFLTVRLWTSFQPRLLRSIKPHFRFYSRSHELSEILSAFGI